MNAPRRRSLRTVLLLLVLVLGLPETLAGAVASADIAPAAQVAWAPSVARPFSAPLWLPLRKPARVSCTYQNCPGPYHDYWAVDLLGQRGDPIYAAGAGVFHIGAIDFSCRQSTSEAAGAWVWIDHGGGLVTKYTPL